MHTYSIHDYDANQHPCMYFTTLLKSWSADSRPFTDACILVGWHAACPYIKANKLKSKQIHAIVSPWVEECNENGRIISQKHYTFWVVCIIQVMLKEMIYIAMGIHGMSLVITGA